MIVSCTTNIARLSWFKGLLTPNQVYKVALYTSEASLDKKTEVYSHNGEVKRFGYTVQTLAPPTYGIDELQDLAYMQFKGDTVWPNSSISADGCMVFCEDLGNLAVYIGAFGSTISSTNDAFTLNLPTIYLK